MIADHAAVVRELKNESLKWWRHTQVMEEINASIIISVRHKGMYIVSDIRIIDKL